MNVKPPKKPGLGKRALYSLVNDIKGGVGKIAEFFVTPKPVSKSQHGIANPNGSNGKLDELNKLKQKNTKKRFQTKFSIEGLWTTLALFLFLSEAATALGVNAQKTGVNCVPNVFVHNGTTYSFGVGNKAKFTTVNNGTITSKTIGSGMVGDPSLIYYNGSLMAYYKNLTDNQLYYVNASNPSDVPHRITLTNNLNPSASFVAADELFVPYADNGGVYIARDPSYSPRQIISGSVIDYKIINVGNGTILVPYIDKNGDLHIRKASNISALSPSLTTPTDIAEVGEMDTVDFDGQYIMGYVKSDGSVKLQKLNADGTLSGSAIDLDTGSCVANSGLELCTDGKHLYVGGKNECGYFTKKFDANLRPITSCEDELSKAQRNVTASTTRIAELEAQHASKRSVQQGFVDNLRQSFSDSASALIAIPIEAILAFFFGLMVYQKNNHDKDNQNKAKKWLCIPGLLAASAATVMAYYLEDDKNNLDNTKNTIFNQFLKELLVVGFTALRFQKKGSKCSRFVEACLPYSGFFMGLAFGGGNLATNLIKSVPDGLSSFANEPLAEKGFQLKEFFKKKCIGDCRNNASSNITIPPNKPSKPRTRIITRGRGFEYHV